MSQRRRVMEGSSSSSSPSSEESSSEEEYVPSSKTARHNKSKPHTSRQQQPAALQQSQADNAGNSGGSQMSTQCSELSEEEFSRCASLVANYFIVAECKKVPVKRADLGKVVGKQHTRRLPPIIEEASKMLQEIYGYRIEELQQKKNCFLLVNCISPAINNVNGSLAIINGAESSEEADEDREIVDMSQHEPGDEKQGLLYLLLTVVFMMGGVMEEVTLYSFLKCLGIYVESRDPHPVYGNCKKLLEEFIKQCYLEVEVMKDMEPPSRQYSWGERANLQLCKKTLLEFFCKMYGGGMRPESWVDHWNKIVGTPPASNGSSSIGSSVEEIMEVDDEPAPQLRRKKQK
uniref:Non-structural maintenance of chromosomes element 3 homolog n=2 Tax=Hirondellea gigas TaxID=1518452 RepID=A0A2P2I690_9CRUS